MKSVLSILFVLLCVSLGRAQAPQLAGDMRTGSIGSSPAAYIWYNNKLYFSADNGTQGRELWSYSGSGQPQFVRDILPGLGSGAPLASGQATRMAELNGQLYFGGATDTFGAELMRYTGSGAPVLGADIIAGSASAQPEGLVTFNNRLYFSARQASGTGRELYSFNGSAFPALHDINPGAGASNPLNLTAFGDRIYFSADTGGNGRELYYFDPTSNASGLVQDINPGAPSATPSGFLAVGSRLYFTATSAASGTELYAFNGATTTRITDLATGASNGVFSGYLGFLNGSVYFGGSTNGTNYQLYRYDTLSSNAQLVSTINSTGSADPFYFATFNNKLFFTARTPGSGYELWSTDGINTAMVADLSPGTASSTPTSLYAANGTLYMTAFTPATGAELFKYNVTTGISKASFGGSVRVFPVPATGDVSLQLDLESRISVYVVLTDIGGRILWSQPVSSLPAGTTVINLPLAYLPAGNYFYALKDEEGSTLAAGKLIKK